MRYRFFIVGKVKEEYLKAAYQEYLKRLSKFGEVSIEYIEESKLKDNPSSLQITKALDEEGERILNKLNPTSYSFLIDLHGKVMDSMEFSKLLDKTKVNGYSEFNFIVGSSNGLSNKLREKCQEKICLSKMTTTHPLALLLVLEQVYRACKISSNEIYHK